MCRHLPSISPQRNSGAARSPSRSMRSGEITLVTSALDALFRNKVETDFARTIQHKFDKWRVGRRLFCGIAELEDVLSCVSRIDLELAHRPLLDGAYTSTRRERALDGLVQEMNGDLDLLASGHVNAAAALHILDFSLAILPFMALCFIDKNDHVFVDLDAPLLEHIMDVPNRRRRRKFAFDDARFPLHLNEDDCLAHGSSLWLLTPTGADREKAMADRQFRKRFLLHAVHKAADEIALTGGAATGILRSRCEV